MSESSPKRHRNILLLSGGAKVAIARIAKQSALNRGAELLISDRSENLPTRFVADRFLCLPDSSSSRWRAELLRIASENKVGLIIPTRESDLSSLASAREALKSIGCVAAVSSTETIDLCGDKWRTFEHIRKLGLPTPNSCLNSEFDSFIQNNSGPFIAKPRYGAGGEAIRFEKNSHPAHSIPSDWIIQQIAAGQEYTVNIYIDNSGDCKCVIPHQRLVIDGGESVQARTKSLPTISEMVTQLAESLPGAIGPINIQLFIDETHSNIQIIEINPRLGGGFPLAHEAKGAYIEWLAREYLDNQKIAEFDQWTRELTMFRYRDAIFEIS